MEVWKSMQIFNRIVVISKLIVFYSHQNDIKKVCNVVAKNNTQYNFRRELSYEEDSVRVSHCCCWLRAKFFFL